MKKWNKIKQRWWYKQMSKCLTNWHDISPASVILKWVSLIWIYLPFRCLLLRLVRSYHTKHGRCNWSVWLCKGKESVSFGAVTIRGESKCCEPVNQKEPAWGVGWWTRWICEISATRCAAVGWQLNQWSLANRRRNRQGRSYFEWRRAMATDGQSRFNINRAVWEIVELEVSRWNAKDYGALQ
jgi:hypothetical protein